MDNLKIGAFLLRLREEKHLTQEEVGEFLKVSNKAVSKWETGEGLPNYESMMGLSKLYAVSIEEILNGERKIPEPEVKTDRSQAWSIFLQVLSLLLSVVGSLVQLSLAVSDFWLGSWILFGLFGGALVSFALSFVFGKGHRYLVLANAVSLYAAGTLFILALCSFGYFGLGDRLWVSTSYILSYALLIVCVPAFAVFLFGRKYQGFVPFLTTYGKKIGAFFLLGEAAFLLVVLLMYINSGSEYLEYGYIGFLSACIAVVLVCGILSFFFDIGELVGTFLGSFLLIWVATTSIYSGTVRYSYDFLLLSVFLIALIYLGFSIASIVLKRKKKAVSE